MFAKRLLGGRHGVGCRGLLALLLVRLFGGLGGGVHRILGEKNGGAGQERQAQGGDHDLSHSGGSPCDFCW